MSLARSSSAVYPFIDIGANLLDPMFQGIYREKALHAPDLPFVIERAKKFGCLNIFCTAGSLEDSKRALQFVREFNSSTSSTSTTATAADDLTSRKFLRSTVGIHPTNATEDLLSMRTSLERDLLELALDGASDSSVVAIGECGLDFLREKDFNCPRHSQFGIWEMHFSLANAANLPMFIHSRESESETLTFLKSHFLKRGGVVHSFDGGYEYAREILTFSDNLYIGINGCSLKTVENLETVKRLPLERLLIESDAPWCGIKGVSAGKALLDASFAREEEGMEEVNKPEKLKGKESLLRTVKSRNEPMNTRDVLQVLALLHPEQDLATISAQIVKNTQKLFGV